MELIYKDTARRIIESPRTKEQMLRMLESIDPVPPKLVKCEITEDVIDAINKIPEQYLVTTADIKEAMRVNNDIRFYIPEGETIPTGLKLYVGDIYVRYERLDGCTFRFWISTEDEKEALEVAQKIVNQMIADYDDPKHGVSRRTVSLEIVPQEERFQIDTIVDWKYRVRDSY